MKVDGSCFCGYLTYAAEIDPATVELCQGLSGSRGFGVPRNCAGIGRELSSSNRRADDLR